KRGDVLRATNFVVSTPHLALPQVRTLYMHRRITIDLPEASSEELKRVQAATGLSIADVFRLSFALLRIYVNARIEGKEIRVVDPNDPHLQTRIEIPFEVLASGSA